MFDLENDLTIAFGIFKSMLHSGLNIDRSLKRTLEGSVSSMYYYELFEALYRKKVNYLLIGGLAVNLYGVPRVTQDIDLIISTDRKNVLAIVKVLDGLGYVPRLPVKPEDLADKDKVRDWIDNRNLKALSFYHGTDQFKVVDILLDHPLDFEGARQRRSVRSVKDIEIYLASMDDLIMIKEHSGRSQDFSDVEMLRKVKDLLEE